jgi:hypothetical protein
MAIKYTNIFYSKAMQKCALVGIFVPSGNPVTKARVCNLCMYVFETTFVDLLKSSPVIEQEMAPISRFSTGKQGCQMVYFKTKKIQLW